MTPHELKALVLEQGEDLVKEYIDVAMGKGKFSGNNMAARESLWELLTHFIRNADTAMVDTDVDIGDANAILKSVADGTITMEEGKQLISMLKAIAEIERPAGTAGAPSVTVIIDAAGKEEQPKIVVHDQDKLEDNTDGD